ncbi:citrate synthase/methylcitrate synthase [Microvirga aerophila]|uniref:citrate synthase (unknown stereospecificity) n=1 Tax=Microvirga aerophila TaxID=670291 RepID=A0A512BMF9_9HYPH|nr:citrate synthase/methylcitrate synthase [Microvirga aerophila]GEO13150.1 citrate synthase/methylcitrate synthase [Microvirga aerophila]
MKLGLDDVIAAETVLSDVDGEAGRLIVRGHDLEELAGQVSFEEAVSILWQWLVPGSTEDLRARFARARVCAFGHLAALSGCLAGLTPVEGMRLLLGALPDADEDPAALAVGGAAVAAAMAVRCTKGLFPVAPNHSFGHAADLLRMLRGSPADEGEAAGLDTYLVTIMDHGLNASTFTARVVASTEAGIISSVVAGLCALKGPLHGGAPGPVLDMLDAIGTADRAEAWLDEAIGRGERLMGFGHRIYRVRDPRADVLKAAAGRLKGRHNRIAFAEDVERAALAVLERRKPGRRLDTNVEFYTALLLEALGVPGEGFTPLFGAGRTAGWVAHAVEQVKTGRIIRPQSRYVGPRPAEAA